MSAGVSAAFGSKYTYVYKRRVPATTNSKKETCATVSAAQKIVGIDKVFGNSLVETISEDFAYMLHEKPGCYILLGNGVNSVMLHNPNYDFNDDILEVGASYWVALVEQQLCF